MIILGALDELDESYDPKVFNVITSPKSLLSWKAICSQVPGIGIWTFGGPLFSLPQSPVDHSKHETQRRKKMVLAEKNKTTYSSKKC